MTTGTAYERLVDALREDGQTVKANGTGAVATCPAHPDRNPSLSLRGIEGQVLLHCHAGCATPDVLSAVGLQMADLYDERGGATYRYDDGRTVHRTPDKKFRQSGNTAATPQLYRQTKVLQTAQAGGIVYLCEGEKDVHALESLGATATTSPMGASNWAKVDASPLAGAHVVIVPDRDEPGRAYAAAAMATLQTIAASVTIRLPKAGKDAADHVAAGYGLDDLAAAELPADSANQPYVRTWQPIDLTSVLDGTWTPPLPTVGRRRDSVGMFYPGKVHTVSSESEAGKTWLALSAAIDELLAGNHVAYIDFEDNEGGIVGRLLTLQVTPAVILERFHYLRPVDPLGTGINLDDLNETLHTHHPTLVIVDGITEAMSLHGLNPLDNFEIAAFSRILPKRIAASGAAVVCLDHVTKDREGRGRYSLGGVHKLNALDGAAYIIENRQPFGIGLTGRSTIKIAKDRPGRLRKHAVPSSGGMHWFGDLVINSHNEEFAEIEIEPPHAADTSFRPTFLMAKMSSLIEEKAGLDGLSGRTLQALAGGKAENNRQALAFLETEGFITRSPHKLIRPYPPVNHDDGGF